MVHIAINDLLDCPQILNAIVRLGCALELPMLSRMWRSRASEEANGEGWACCPGWKWDQLRTDGDGNLSLLKKQLEIKHDEAITCRAALAPALCSPGISPYSGLKCEGLITSTAQTEGPRRTSDAPAGPGMAPLIDAWDIPGAPEEDSKSRGEAKGSRYVPISVETF